MIKSSKIAAASLKDRKRYDQNPLGPSYLTRGERWTQAYYYAKAREANPRCFLNGKPE